MVLSTEWTQLEVIDLLNDGSGLGFGIIGGKSTGVVVKTILPGGVADRDGRLRSGDHLLQIGDVMVRGMGSEQVATVLRQSGAHVRLIVARCVQEATDDAPPHAPIIPTHQLDEHLAHLNEMLMAVAAGGHYGMMAGGGGDADQNGPEYLAHMQQADLQAEAGLPEGAHLGPGEENFDVELVKDTQGLGITIAGYVGDKAADELSGIFVRSIAEGSAAALDGRIQLNDQIIAVDSQPLEGFSNQQAVDVLRNTGQVVRLKLARYKHGPKYQQLQHYIIHRSPQVFELSTVDIHHPLHSPARLQTLPPLLETQDYSSPVSVSEKTTAQQQMRPSQTKSDPRYQPLLKEPDLLPKSQYALALGQTEENQPSLGAEAPILSLTDQQAANLYSGELQPHVEASLSSQWQTQVGDEYQIIVAQLSKFKEGGGLGISLEGTVDVENGVEKRPHHYIRSVLEDGPVGLNGRLQGGDELLEVNGIRLLGLNHKDVVTVLKELPQHVRIVCARRLPTAPFSPSDANPDLYAASQTDSEVFAQEPPLSPASERLVKAKSEQDLPVTTGYPTQVSESLNRMKSRSLEPLAGFAMWSSEPTVIELAKGDRGLGFSILDYQDPINPSETVIVIRSLVPGGVAQVDGRLVPGDRLIFVNDVNLENATLDQAVQALKGASRGMVLIGVFKPLPLPEIGESSTDDFPEEVSTEAATAEELPQMAATVPSAETSAFAFSQPSLELTEPPQLPDISPPHSPPPSPPPAYGTAGASVAMETFEEGTLETKMPEMEVENEEEIDMYSSEAPPAPPTGPPPLFPRDPYHVVEMETEPTPPPGRADSPPPYLPPAPVSLTTPPPSARTTNLSDLKSASSNGSMASPYGATSPVPSPASPRSPASPQRVMGILPVSLEKQVRIHKGTDQLGMTVESADQPANGCVVKTLSAMGAVAKDGHIAVGDYIISVNNESMRGITNAQARAIMRRAQLLGTDISVSYISAHDALQHRESPTAALRDQHFPSQLSPNSTVSSLGSQTSSHSPASSLDSEIRSPVSPSNPPDLLADRPLTQSPNNLPLGTDMSALYRSPSSPPDYSEVLSRSSEVTLESSGLAPHRSSPVAQQSFTSSSSTSPVPIPTGAKSLSFASSPSSSPQTSAIIATETISVMATSPSALPSEGRSVDSSWGPPRVVEVHRRPGENLGINIIGGRVDLFHMSPENQRAISGIFIKHVSDSSPAGAGSLLKKGDRLLEVDDTDLRNATHDEAVAAIKRSTNKVRFLVQSLVEPQWSSQDSDMGPTLETYLTQELQKSTESGTPIVGIDTPTVRVEGSAPAEPSLWPQGEHTEIPRDVDFKNEQADEYGYTMEGLLKKYGDLGGQLHMVEVVRRGSIGLGLSLAGNRDLGTMSVFVVGIQPESNAARDGRIRVGDELLEINGQKLFGRCHLNASAIIKSITTPTVKIILLRREDFLAHMAVRPLRLPPVDHRDDPNTLIPKKVPKLQKDLSKSNESESSFDAEMSPVTCTEPPSSTDNHVGPARVSSVDLSQFNNIKTVTLQKASQGLGFAIQEGSRDGQPGIYVKAVTPGGAASQEGQLAVGDRILAVQNLSVINSDYNQAIDTLRKVKRGSVSLTFNQTSPSSSSSSETAPPKVDGPPLQQPELPPVQDAPPLPKRGPPPEVESEPVPPSKVEPPVQMANGTQEQNATPPKQAKQDPVSETPDTTTTTLAPPPTIELPDTEQYATCPITPGRETTIEIEKGKTGLGLSIIGGADTLLGTIIVHEVYEEGAASKDGRLWAGDQILEVNSVDLRNATHDRAINVLRQTPATVRIVVFRDETLLKDEEFYEVFTVELMKKHGKGLGLTIVGRKKDTGIFISEIVKGGVADTDGRLLPGDQILSVNGQDLKNSTQEDGATLLKTLMGKVALTVGRLKAGSGASSRRSSSQSSHSNLGLKKSDSSVSNRSKGKHSKSVSTGSSSDVCDVTLEREGSGSLGISITGGLRSPIGNMPIMVADLNPSGLAAKSGHIQIGDCILAINDQSTDEMTQTAAVECLKATSGPVTLQVTRAEKFSLGSDTSSPLPEELQRRSSVFESNLNDSEPGSLQTHTIVLDKGNEGLGFSIVGGYGSRQGDLPIYVKTIYETGAAARDQQLKRGDQILAVNGTSLEGSTHAHAVSILTAAQGRVELIVSS